jgi:triosephosphate isomerase (TIM)
MTLTLRPLIAGNWKMNGLKVAAREFKAIIEGAGEVSDRLDLLVCPPATLLMGLAHVAKGTPVMVGAQDCHAKASGAHTGDLSAEIVADAGASVVIVGHSERRAMHNETDAVVRAKAAAALRAGLTAIICVGETEAQRDAGHTIAIVSDQLGRSIPDKARRCL